MKQSVRLTIFVFFSFLLLLLFTNFESIKPVVTRKATEISPEELLARPLPQNLQSIPKILHQSWSDNALPTKFGRWSQSCRSKNSDWEWVLWTDEDNLKLVKTHMPWLLSTYESLPSPIYQADVVRNLYMYIYGGVYADLDIECLRPYNEMFSTYNQTTSRYTPTSAANNQTRTSFPSASDAQSQGPDGQRRAFFGSMGTDLGFVGAIPNAWMASTPGHPFFLFQLMELERTITRGGFRGQKVEAVTGPAALQDNLDSYKKRFRDGDKLDREVAKNPSASLFASGFGTPQTVQILPFWNIYPYSWHRDGDAYHNVCWSVQSTFDPTRCKLLLGTDHWPSYTITYWSHTWTSEGHDESNLNNVQDD